MPISTPSWCDHKSMYCWCRPPWSPAAHRWSPDVTRVLVPLVPPSSIHVTQNQILIQFWHQRPSPSPLGGLGLGLTPRPSANFLFAISFQFHHCQSVLVPYEPTIPLCYWSLSFLEGWTQNPRSTPLHWVGFLAPPSFSFSDLLPAILETWH